MRKKNTVEDFIKNAEPDEIRMYQEGLNENMICDFCDKELGYSYAGPDTLGVQYFLKCNSIYPTFACPECTHKIAKVRIIEE